MCKSTKSLAPFLSEGIWNDVVSLSFLAQKYSEGLENTHLPLDAKHFKVLNYCIWTQLSHEEDLFIK
jgi:hypothetical protein